MGKGIALQFKFAFPENYRHYQQACRAGDVRLGRMLVTDTDRLVNPRHIINFPTKQHWKAKSRLEDIQAGLPALIAEVNRLGIRSIAVPPLGCGNGGLDWKQVRPLIEAAFAEVAHVHVLLFEPEDAPDAGAMRVATRRPNMTRGRALLLCLLDLYRIPGYRLTKLEVQKLAYFLQTAGEPLKLDYVRHKYGPYAENLNHVLQNIEGHFISGFGDRSRNAQISPLPEALTEANTFLATSAEARERLGRVADLIEGFDNPSGMELLATVHWVGTHSAMATTNEEITIALVQAWSDRKRTLFKPDHIRLAWRHLRALGWLTPPPAQ
jgi:O-acetyl-ADP-ribose deacetylase (regulator of RNase III)